jgi:hypothetical protein
MLPRGNTSRVQVRPRMVRAEGNEWYQNQQCISAAHMYAALMYSGGTFGTPLILCTHKNCVGRRSTSHTDDFLAWKEKTAPLVFTANCRPRQCCSASALVRREFCTPSPSTIAVRKQAAPQEAELTHIRSQHKQPSANVNLMTSSETTHVPPQALPRPHACQRCAGESSKLPVDVSNVCSKSLSRCAARCTCGSLSCSRRAFATRETTCSLACADVTAAHTHNEVGKREVAPA